MARFLTKQEKEAKAIYLKSLYINGQYYDAVKRGFGDNKSKTTILANYKRAKKIA